MDVARIVLEYLQALIWPAVVVVGIFLFRRGIRDVLGRIRKGSGWGVTIEMEERAERLAGQSEALPELESELPSRELGAGSTEVPEIEEVDPNPSRLGRILAAWQTVEVVVRYQAVKLGLVDVRGGTGKVIRELDDRKLISPDTAKVARDLQALRNQVVHQADQLEVTEAMVEDFEAASRNLRRALLLIDTPSS